MQRVPAPYVSLFIRSVEWQAQEQGVPFLTVLKSAAQAKITATVDGLALVGTATDGTSANFALPQASAGMSLTPESLAAMIGVLWDWSDEFAAQNPGPPVPTDAQLIAYLRCRNKPVPYFRMNFRPFVFGQ